MCRSVTYVAAKLIAEVRAVVFPVTLEGAGDTGAVEALELILRATGTTCNSSSSTSELENSQWSRRKHICWGQSAAKPVMKCLCLSCLTACWSFCSCPAPSDSIKTNSSTDTEDPAQWSSGSSGTIASRARVQQAVKKKGKTQGQLTAVDFVRVVLAVGASVAPPAAVDALSIRTHELPAAAAPGRLPPVPVANLRPLVGAVATVAVAVAAPLGRDAHGVVALEGVAAAGGSGAGRLVRAVRTVLVLVAHEGGGDALAVGAPELVVLAFFGSWSGRNGGNVSSEVVFRILLLVKLRTHRFN